MLKILNETTLFIGKMLALGAYTAFGYWLAEDTPAFYATNIIILVSAAAIFIKHTWNYLKIIYYS